MKITFDQFSKSINRQDGEVGFDEAADIVFQYIQGQKDTYESEEEPFAISIFAFRRDARNFIEIAIDSKSNYRVRLECKYSKKLWRFSWNATYDKDLHVPSESGVVAIVKEFFEQGIDEFRESFERLPYKESKYVGIGAV